MKIRIVQYFFTIIGIVISLVAATEEEVNDATAVLDNYLMKKNNGIYYKFKEIKDKQNFVVFYTTQTHQNGIEVEQSTTTWVVYKDSLTVNYSGVILMRSLINERYLDNVDTDNIIDILHAINSILFHNQYTINNEAIEVEENENNYIIKNTPFNNEKDVVCTKKYYWTGTDEVELGKK